MTCPGKPLHSKREAPEGPLDGHQDRRTRFAERQWRPAGARLRSFQEEVGARSNELLKKLESIGGEPLEGSGFEDEPTKPCGGLGENGSQSPDQA
jgi:hypothetical protein